MMKTLMRWGTATGLMGMAWLGCVAIGFMPQALAETTLVQATEGQTQPDAATIARVVQKLQFIPVFLVGDAEGGLGGVRVIQREAEAGQPAPEPISIIPVFLDRDDANAFKEELSRENPQLNQEVTVGLSSLADVYLYQYQWALENQDQPNRLRFEIIPDRQQLQSARTILESQGRSVEQVPKVPIFLATAADGIPVLFWQAESDAENAENSEVFFPLFLSYEDLQQTLSEVDPNIAADAVQIHVFSLEGLIDDWERDSDPNLDRLILVPLPESKPLIPRLLQREAPQQ